MTRTYAGRARGQDLAPVSDEGPQKVHVLKIDVVHFVLAKAADFAFGHEFAETSARTACVSRPGTSVRRSAG